MSRSRISMRPPAGANQGAAWLCVACACTVLACAGTPVALPPVNESARLRLIGEAVLARAPDADGRRADVGGLSGAYYDAEQQRLYAVSDDRDEPRLIVFALEVEPAVQLTPVGVVPLQPPPGGVTLDAEGLAPAPNGHFFISSEGDRVAPGEPAPGIYEYTRAGRFVRQLPLPAVYQARGGETGMRPNGAFEALTASPDGRRLFAATESPLRQDGDEVDFDRGGVVRVLVYDLDAPGRSPREYAYGLEPVRRPKEFGEATGDNGVSEMLALSHDELLVLERGFVRESGFPAPRSANTIHVYRVRLDASAEVTGRDSLRATPPAAMLSKTLVLDGAAVAPELSETLRGLENFEAMAFGPRLRDGSASLLLLSDDNFSSRQVTALLVFAVGPRAGRFRNSR